MKPSFDRLAKLYEPLERITFGNTLKRARIHYLPQARDCQRGLLIGDGDGRLSAQLLRENPNITLDSIDISPAMLERASERAGKNKKRLNSICRDALHHAYLPRHYGYLGLHFSLDCFSQAQAEQLLPKLENALQPGGLIAYTDFRADTAWQRIIVRGLYLCFRASTGLATQRLPQIVWSHRIRKISEQRFLKGLILSQLLRKS